ncbi:DNA-directed RNA polymerase III subunit RPC5 [Anopheles ziemanni]|uniref:DNA-directed RNA polymerase III subunit RPC5 n=1 Tax=Anopheles coustani TaxID=139045 RepID=UPI00265A596B|nr:DNA-directed RNA polymerase III subunit RPC5 [Anopheles coustani]XP_058174391.1 DNA-directed RNA polymerase III subunit RPC5 [Anopheles ziemanni]
MEDEDDPVVEEIPVHLSKTLADNLFLLQYPVKSSATSFDDVRVVNCCVKPINQQIKIDYELDSGSTNYDSFKGEQFALAADGRHGRDKLPKVTFRSGTMDKQSFLSTKPIEDVSRYLVCVLQDGEMHATPLKGIVSMRQMFSYFDKQDNRTKAEQKAEQDADGVAEEEELTQVTVKFARTENEKVRKAREKSFTYLAKRESEEPWCEAFWHEKQSSAAELERQKLFGGSASASASGSFGRVDPDSAALNVHPVEYMDMLISKEKTDRNIDRLLPSRVVCMHKLNELPLLEQLKVILTDAKVVTFQQILRLISDRTVPAEKVLRLLPQVGWLIRGNWVVQSEYIYPEGSVSGTNGVSAEQMCKARDYILYRFTKCDKLERHHLTSITQLPMEEIREILCSIAKLNAATRTWSMLLPPNDNFLSVDEQEISDRQSAFWLARSEKFSEMEQTSSTAGGGSTTKRVRKRSTRDSGGSGLTVPTATVAGSATATTTASSSSSSSTLSRQLSNG